MVDWLKRKRMNVLVVGANGMLGSAVLKRFQKESMKKHSKINSCIGLTKEDYQLGDFSTALARMCEDKMVDVVINCAAFTDTAGCEDKQNLEKSYIANVLGVKNLASTCAYHKVKLVHISTDYVYSQHSYMYQPWIYEFPCNMYGMQKLLGEREMQLEYAHWPEGQLICRMSWLYGNTKKHLFMHKILAAAYRARALMAEQNKDEAVIKAAADQFGSPQTVDAAASKILNLVCEGVYGTVNCWTSILNETRFSFAQHILKSYVNMVDRRLAPVKVEACKSTDFVSVVEHPLFSDKAGLPNEYLASNSSFCKLGSGRKFTNMLLKTKNSIDDILLDYGAIASFIRENSQALKEHVFGMLDDKTKDILSKLSEQ